MTEPNEMPIAAVDAQNHSYRKSKSGIVVSFLIHPNDPHEGITKLDLGEVVRLYVTKPNIGA